MSTKFNHDKQHTLKATANISGTGLHTGILVDMILKPANPGYGIQFQRVDLPNQPTIKADCDLVTDTSRGTTLESNGAKISTVEHVMAAVVGMGNALKLDVIAEGVESEAQLEHLRNLNCRFVQGFLLGRPSSASNASEIVLRNRVALT